MALRGWRLIGVAGTIFAYVAGILFLSLVSIQSPQQRRLRGFGGGGGSNGAAGRSVSEVDLLRTRELGLLGRRQPLQWCRLLRYIDSDHPFKGWPIIGTKQHKSQNDYINLNSNQIGKNKILQTFPGHYINNKDNYMLRGTNNIIINHSSSSSSGSSSSSSSSSTSISNEKLKNDKRPKTIDFSLLITATTTTASPSTIIKNNNNNNNYYYLNNRNIYNNNEIKINYEPIWPQINHRSSSLIWRLTDNNINNNNNNDNNKLDKLNEITAHQDIDKKATTITTSTKLLANNRDNNINNNPRNSKNNKKKTSNSDKGNQSNGGGGGGDGMNGLTALASFPGSGNTWLRYLLQQATGILTGSVYKDYGLLKSGFPAENVCNKSVLIIKTHEWGPHAWSRFTKAVLLIRDPDKAILAEFNRQSGGHVGFASPDRYKRTKGRYWQHFVTNKLWAWEQMNLAWARNFTGEIKIIFYDDLVGDVETVLRAILQFINFTIDEDLLTCALERREGIYRRRRRIMSFDPYSPAMHKIMNDKRDEVYAALGRINP